jgi:hypothetical protein
MKTMNKIIFAFVALLAVGFTGCTEDPEPISRVTNYPDFTFNGDAVMIHQLGDTYTDPGVTATEAGADIEVTSSASGVYRFGTSMDVNVSDQYHITYSATNKDGFAGSVSRDVYVVNNGDLTSSIEGIYTATIVRNGVASPQYENLQYVIIWKNADGTYELSDAIGGYYSVGRGYGNGYISPGLVVTANDIGANDFSYSDYAVRTFGGECTASGMTVDAGNKTINFLTSWVIGSTTYDFDVTLTQVPF